VRGIDIDEDGGDAAGDENDDFDDDEDDADVKLDVNEDSSEGSEDNDDAPLLAAGDRKKRDRLKRLGGKPKKGSPQDEEAKAAVRGLKEFLGTGGCPADADWLEMSYFHHDTGEVSKNGKLLIAIQIVSVEEAEESPVGSGRREPNINPYLPPPVGRMKLSANPLSMLKVGAQLVHVLVQHHKLRTIVVRASVLTIARCVCWCRS
jgi:hypothetical protein